MNFVKLMWLCNLAPGAVRERFSGRKSSGLWMDHVLTDLRKQEDLRNVESIIGLRRGMLSDAQVDVRTATEIASSAGDFSLVLRSYQQVWEQALRQVAQLCRVLSEL